MPKGSVRRVRLGQRTLARLGTYRPKAGQGEQREADDLVKRELAAARVFADQCRSILRAAGVLS